MKVKPVYVLMILSNGLPEVTKVFSSFLNFQKYLNEHLGKSFTENEEDEMFDYIIELNEECLGDEILWDCVEIE